MNEEKLSTISQGPKMKSQVKGAIIWQGLCVLSHKLCTHGDWWFQKKWQVYNVQQSSSLAWMLLHHTNGSPAIVSWPFGESSHFCQAMEAHQTKLLPCAQRSCELTPRQGQTHSILHCLENISKSASCPHKDLKMSFYFKHVLYSFFKAANLKLRGRAKK